MPGRSFSRLSQLQRFGVQIGIHSPSRFAGDGAVRKWVRDRISQNSRATLREDDTLSRKSDSTPHWVTREHFPVHCPSDGRYTASARRLAETFVANEFFSDEIPRQREIFLERYLFSGFNVDGSVSYSPLAQEAETRSRMLQN
jgi:hypothetical protein